MRHRTLIGVVASTVFAAGLLAVVANGQTKAPAASRQPYAVPRRSPDELHGLTQCAGAVSLRPLQFSKSTRASFLDSRAA